VEILFLIVLALFLWITWLPVGLLTLRAYMFLNKINFVGYEFTPDARKNILYWGWLSLIFFVLMMPYDLFLRRIIDTERIKEWFERAAGADKAESQTKDK